MALNSTNRSDLEQQKFVESSTTAGQPAVVVTNSDGSDIGSGTTTGSVAHDAVDSGNPVKIGGYAADPTSLPTAVAAGDRTNAAYSLQGETLAYLSRLISGESSSRLRTQIEHAATSQYVITSDTAVAATSGKLYGAIFSCNDAAPTAGSVDFYDSLSATGDKLYSETFTTTAFRGYVVTFFGVPFGTGLYVDFTTTADVNVLPLYLLD